MAESILQEWVKKIHKTVPISKERRFDRKRGDHFVTETLPKRELITYADVSTRTETTLMEWIKIQT